MIGVPALIITGIGILLVRRIFADELATADRVTGSKAGYMAETYGVVLGLMLAAAFAGYQEMQETVLGESQSLKAILHVTPNLPGAQRAELEEGVRRYVQLVIEDEWPKLALGEADDAAEATFQRLFTIAAQPPGDAGLGASFLAVNQVQGLLQDVLRRRTTRLAAGPGRPLAELLSEILVGLTLVAVAIPWFLDSRSFLLAPAAERDAGAELHRPDHALGRAPLSLRGPGGARAGAVPGRAALTAGGGEPP